MKEISVIVPFFNEEAVIVESSKRIHRYLTNNFQDFELIFVDDGSVDNSSALIKTAIEKLPKTSLITSRVNAGRENAIKKGLTKATGKIQGYIDVDLEIGIEYLELAIKHLSRSDVVIASKFARGAKVKAPRMRKISSIFFNYFVNLALQTKVLDHQAGFKFFKKAVLDNILSQSSQNGWLWDIEILYLSKKSQYTVIELPVEITYGYRNIRSTFLLDFLKMPFFVLSLKRTIDKKINYAKN